MNVNQLIIKPNEICFNILYKLGEKKRGSMIIKFKLFNALATELRGQVGSSI